MQDLKIALIQTNVYWEDKEANLKHIEQAHFSKLKPGDCDLLLLPEMFTTGFSMKSDVLAEEMTGPTVTWLQKWAQYFDCQIGASMITADSKRFYNRFLIVSKTGIEAYYDKRHLFRMAAENDHYSPGTKRVIHRLKGWNILLQVCYDLRFPVFSRNRTINGQKEYDAAIYIANWPEKRRQVWSTLLRARAIENQVFSVGLNRVGSDENGIDYSGDSAVIDPWGTVLFEAVSGRENVEIVTLNSHTLAKITADFPAFKDADRFDLTL
jgi:omega-amidase